HASRGCQGALPSPACPAGTQHPHTQPQETHPRAPQVTHTDKHAHARTHICTHTLTHTHPETLETHTHSHITHTHTPRDRGFLAVAIYLQRTVPRHTHAWLRDFLLSME